MRHKNKLRQPKHILLVRRAFSLLLAFILISSLIILNITPILADPPTATETPTETPTEESSEEATPSESDYPLCYIKRTSEGISGGISIDSILCSSFEDYIFSDGTCYRIATVDTSLTSLTSDDAWNGMIIKRGILDLNGSHTNTLEWFGACAKVTDEEDCQNIMNMLNSAQVADCNDKEPYPYSNTGDTGTIPEKPVFPHNFLIPKEDEVSRASNQENKFALAILDALSEKQPEQEQSTQPGAERDTVSDEEGEDVYEGLLLTKYFESSTFVNMNYELAFKQNMVLGNYIRPGMDTLSQIVNTPNIKAWLSDDKYKGGLIQNVNATTQEYITVPLYKGQDTSSKSNARATVRDLFDFSDEYLFYFNYYEAKEDLLNVEEEEKVSADAADPIGKTGLSEYNYDILPAEVYCTNFSTYLYYDQVFMIFPDILGTLSKHANDQLAMDMYGNIIISSTDVNVNETVVLPAMANPFFAGSKYFFTNRYMIAGYNNEPVSSFIGSHPNTSPLSKKDIEELFNGLNDSGKTIISSISNNDTSELNYSGATDYANGNTEDYTESEVWPQNIAMGIGTKLSARLSYYDVAPYTDQSKVQETPKKFLQISYGVALDNKLKPRNTTKLNSEGILLWKTEYNFPIFHFTQQFLAKTWKCKLIDVSCTGFEEKSFELNGGSVLFPYFNKCNYKVSDLAGENDFEIYELVYGSAERYLGDFKNGGTTQNTWLNGVTDSNNANEFGIFYQATIGSIFDSDNGPTIIDHYCKEGTGGGEGLKEDGTWSAKALSRKFYGRDTARGDDVADEGCYLYCFIRAKDILFTLGDGSVAEEIIDDGSESTERDAASIIKNMAYMLSHLGESLTKISTMKNSYTYKNLISTPNDTVFSSNHLFEIDQFWEDPIINKILSVYINLILIINCIWLIVKLIPLFSSNKFEVTTYLFKWVKAIVISLAPVILFIIYINTSNWIISKAMRNTMSYWTSIQLENINKETSAERSGTAALTDFLSQTVNVDVSSQFATVNTIKSTAVLEDGEYPVEKELLSTFVEGIQRNAITYSSRGTESYVIKEKLMANRGTDSTINMYQESIFYYFYDVLRVHYYQYFFANTSTPVNLTGTEEGHFANVETGMSTTYGTFLKMVNDPTFLYGQSWLNNANKIGDFNKASNNDISNLQVQDICGFTELFSLADKNEYVDLGLRGCISNANWYVLLRNSPSLQEDMFAATFGNDLVNNTSYADAKYYGDGEHDLGTTSYPKVIFGAASLYPVNPEKPKEHYNPSEFEFALNQVNEQVAQDLLLLNDYSTCTDETLMQLAAFTMTMDFNRIMNSSFKPSQNLQPQIYNGDSYSLDTILRSFFLSSSTELGSTYDTDIMTMVEGKGGIVAQALIIVCACAASALGIVRYLVLLLLLLLSIIVFMAVYNLARNFYNKAILGLTAMYAGQLAVFAVFMFCVSLLCVPQSAVITKSVFQGFLGFIKLIVFIVVIIFEIIAIGFFLYHSLKHFRDLGGDIVADKINTIKTGLANLVSQGVNRFTGKFHGKGDASIDAHSAIINTQNGTEESTKITEEDKLNQGDVDLGTDVNRAREKANKAVEDETFDMSRYFAQDESEDAAVEEARTEAESIVNENDVENQTINEAEDANNEINIEDAMVDDIEQVDDISVEDAEQAGEVDIDTAETAEQATDTENTAQASTGTENTAQSTTVQAYQSSFDPTAEIASQAVQLRNVSDPSKKYRIRDYAGPYVNVYKNYSEDEIDTYLDDLKQSAFNSQFNGKPTNEISQSEKAAFEAKFDIKAANIKRRANQDFTDYVDAQRINRKLNKLYDPTVLDESENSIGAQAQIDKINKYVSSMQFKKTDGYSTKKKFYRRGNIFTLKPEQIGEVTDCADEFLTQEELNNLYLEELQAYLVQRSNGIKLEKMDDINFNELKQEFDKGWQDTYKNSVKEMNEYKKKQKVNQLAGKYCDSRAEDYKVPPKQSNQKSNIPKGIQKIMNSSSKFS